MSIRSKTTKALTVLQCLTSDSDSKESGSSSPSMADTEPHVELVDSEIDFSVRPDYSDDPEELHELQSDPKITNINKQAVISPVLPP